MPLGIGNYPPEFNPKIHGPFNPAVYYGKADIPLGEVKLGEMTSWLGRRNYHPLAMSRAVGRAYWRWSQKWLLPRRTGFAGVGQLCLATSIFFYANLYSFLKYHRHTKYH